MDYKIGDYVWLGNGMLVQIVGFVTTCDVTLWGEFKKNNKTYRLAINFGASQWNIKRKANIKIK